MTTEAIMRRVIVEAGTECWRWTGKKTKSGYGVIAYNRDERADTGKTGTTAHRYLYERAFGRLPEGIELDHSQVCGNRSCVNVFHVDPVTHRVNMERGSNATRKFCKNGHSLDDAYLRKGRSGVQRHCRSCTIRRVTERYRRLKKEANAKV